MTTQFAKIATTVASLITTISGPSVPASFIMPTSTILRENSAIVEVIEQTTYVIQDTGTEAVASEPYKLMSVKERVMNYFTDTPILAEIARCESHYRHLNEKTGEILRGTYDVRDVGVMQINEHYHLKQAVRLGFDIYTLDGNMAYAKHLYEQKGVQPWSASKPCWGKTSKELAKR